DQRAAAIHQYRECVRVLEQELGVAPLEETTQLYEAIKENRAPPLPIIHRRHPTAPNQQPKGEAPARERTPHAAPMSNRPPPIVGRQAEWTALRNAYASAGSTARLIVIEGEAGIGKTRLAEELLRHAENGGATTITARCYEGETTMAYGPFTDGL